LIQCIFPVDRTPGRTRSAVGLTRPPPLNSSGPPRREGECLLYRHPWLVLGRGPGPGAAAGRGPPK